MKKSKHFRKDVILARVIAGVLLLVLIVLLVLGISLLKKTSGQGKESQNTEGTQNIPPESQDTEDLSEQGSEDIEDTQGTSSESEDTELEVVPKTYIKTTATLRLREEPNTSCETLEHIPEGTTLEVIEKTGIWYKVSYNEKTGYVSSTYVEVVEEE